MHAMIFSGSCAAILRPRYSWESRIGAGAGVSLIEIVAALEAIFARHVRRRHLKGRPFNVALNVLVPRLALRELGWRSETPLDERECRTLDSLGSRAASAEFARPQ